MHFILFSRDSASSYSNQVNLPANQDFNVLFLVSRLKKRVPNKNPRTSYLP